MDKTSRWIIALMCVALLCLFVSFSISASKNADIRNELQQKCEATGGIIVVAPYDDKWSRICIDAKVIDTTDDE